MDDDDHSNVIDLRTREPFAEPSLWRRVLASWQISFVVVVALWSVVAASIYTVVQRDRAVEVPAGEWRTYSLTDGSVVRIGPRTRLHFDFGDDRRFVHLWHGEAFFDVATDRSRPFIVESGSFEARAVGTRFAVSRRDNRVVVTVQEGKVEVGRRQDGKYVGVAVAAGRQVDVSEVWPSAARDIDVERELAWTVGKLIFGQGDTVHEAVAEFNHRNRVQIVVEDEGILDRRVGGVFLADRPEIFATFLQNSLPVHVVRESPGVLKVMPGRVAMPVLDRRDRSDKD